MSTADFQPGELSPTDLDFAATLSPDSSRQGGDAFVVVIVHAPKDVNPKRFRFLRDDLVGDAAKVAAVSFGYQAGTPSFQTEGGAVLDRGLTLNAAGVRNGQTLELVDVGGGV
jgi:hypothetical protein